MTPVDICNAALLKLGEARIMALSDANKPARACNTIYEATRDEVLRTHRWGFAKDRATLAVLVQAPAFGWAKQYQLPTDCLRVISLNGETEEESAEYEVEGGKLLTDELEARIRYVKRVTDSSLFDSLFCEALATLLASKLAVTLTSSSTKAQDLITAYERLTKPNAIKVNAAESKPRKNYMDGALINSRTIAARMAGMSIPVTEP